MSGATGPVIFTDSIASYNYARKLAGRYKQQKNIIWILGGDRAAIDKRDEGQAKDYRPIWRSMAKAIQAVYGKKVFIAYHPNWFTGEYFGAEDDWLSMNAMQSGHGSREVTPWELLRSALKMEPRRPFMDMEPCYEDHPVSPWDGKWTKAGRGYFNDYDVRARIYRGIFAGGCGAVYGHHQVWQFVDTSRYQPVFTGDTLLGWKQAILTKGAFQMKHLKKLMSLHKDLEREEDSLLIASDRGSDYRDIIIATRSKNRSYAMIYLPRPEGISINLDRLNKGKKKISWLNPVTGNVSVLPQRYTIGIVTFQPPDYIQRDWVLLIEAGR